MRPEFKVKRLRKDRIIAIAENFLREHNPSNSIPVPIEEIIELDLEMDIIPIPGLKDTSKAAGLDIDGFISSDLRSITVDQYILEKRGNRYRFTLAHEVSHRILHPDIYQQYEFSNIDNWISTIISIQSSSQKTAREWAEWQADQLAGLILVPKSILAVEFNKEIEETFKVYSEDHPVYTLYSDQVDYLDFIRDITVRSLAQQFVVSKDTMRIRLENDGLIERRR